MVLAGRLLPRLPGGGCYLRMRSCSGGPGWDALLRLKCHPSSVTIVAAVDMSPDRVLIVEEVTGKGVSGQEER